MKILLIIPEANIHKLEYGPLNISFREAPLTLTTLAALVPRELEPQITLVDENVQKLPDTMDYDLVGISCITGTSTRAYKLAGRYRAKGIPVVMGGIHAALRTEEVSAHSDTTVIGSAENTWPQLLRDFSDGEMKKLYRENGEVPYNIPLPRRDLQKKLGYMSPNTVAATRGCKNKCDFCSVPAAGYGWKTRPVAEVIDEIRSIKSRRIVFNDVSLLEDRQYARELFTALAKEKKVWGGLCTTKIGRDDEMLELMVRSGCIYLLIGFESIENNALNSIAKGFNRSDNYSELMQKLHAHHIAIQGCFIFGFDSDTKESIDRTVEAVEELKIDIPRYAIYTPYPGTPAFDRLKIQGRLLNESWEHYDTQHVVFQPANMSPEELDEHFRSAWQRTFTFNSILKRTAGRVKRFPINFLGNLAYRMYVSRLRNEKNRIYKENTANNLMAAK